MTYPCVCALELEEAVSRQRGDGVSLLPVPQLLDKLLLLSPTVHFVACAVTEICGRITLHCEQLPGVLQRREPRAETCTRRVEVNTGMNRRSLW